MSRRHLRAVGRLAWAAFLCASVATADPVSRRFERAADGSLSGTVPVTLVGQDGKRLFVGVHPEGRGSPSFYIEQCRTPCTVEVPRGRYRIYVAETRDTFGGGRRELIDAPMRLTVIPRAREKRTIGLALGILGPVAMITGGVLLLNGLDPPLDGPCSDCGNHRAGEALAGLALILGGAVITPIGWVLFGKSFHPAIEVERRGEPTFAPRFGVIPVRGGVGFGASFSL